MADRPNILLIVTDQQRIDTISAWGNPLIRTPVLDALAAGGVNCSEMHVSCPVCQPSRSAFMSGRYNRTNAAVWNGTPLPPGEKTLPVHLREHGYRSEGVGKIYHHHSNDDMELVFDAYGGEFDRFGPYPHDAPLNYHDQQGKVRNHDWGVYPEAIEEYTDHHIADWAIDSLQRLSTAEQPWMLTVGFMNPHTPWYAPQRFFDLRDDIVGVFRLRGFQLPGERSIADSQPSGTS